MAFRVPQAHRFTKLFFKVVEIIQKWKLAKMVYHTIQSSKIESSNESSVVMKQYHFAILNKSQNF